MRFILPSILSIIITLFNDLPSEVSFYPTNLPYNPSSMRVALKMSHACGENATNQVDTIFPENFVIIPERKQGWTTSVNTLTSASDQTSSNIIWQSNDPANNIPDGFNELFWVWITFPTSYQLDTKYYAPTIQYCYPSGQKMWNDITSPSEHMAPYFTIRDPDGGDSGDNTSPHFSRMDMLTISSSIISIITFLMSAYNVYKRRNPDSRKTTQKAQLEMADVESNVIVHV
jgi:uncharacterized protein YcnI